MRFEDVARFRVGDVERPPSFFGLPSAENVSAVIFANSGTVPKFGRMAYQEGIGRGALIMRRYGLRYVHDPDAVEPAAFGYEVGERMETWGEGLEVFHNPNALYPLDNDVFLMLRSSAGRETSFPATMPPARPAERMALIVWRWSA